MTTTTIDMTPTFEQATRMCITVLHRGTPEGIRMAEEELLRYARELDRLKAQAGTEFDAADTPIG
jgi:hypothetical protein